MLCDSETLSSVLACLERRSLVTWIFGGWAEELHGSGVNPTTLMLSSERPKVSIAKRPPIFTTEEIEQTLAAATEPFRTLFTVAALTGGPVSELCGLTWADVHVEDIDDSEITFA